MIIEFFGPFVLYFQLLVLTVHYLNKHSITLQDQGHSILSQANNFTLFTALLLLRHSAATLRLSDEVYVVELEVFPSGPICIFQLLNDV